VHNIPEEADAAEAPEVISFKEEVIGFIEDELIQGYGLEQIKKDLLNEGYPPEIIEFAADYVEKHNNISQHEKQKQLPKTENHHVARRFHIPLMAIAVLVIALLAVFFYLGIGEEEKKEAPEKIDVFLYEDLGLTPGVQKIAGSKQAYAKDELKQDNVAESILLSNRNNAVMSRLQRSDAVEGFQKRATVFSIIDRGMQKRTLVEIRFQPTKDGAIKIVESIPKNTAASDEEIILTQGGIIAEKDPIIVFTFGNAKAGKAEKAVYVINKEISTLDTTTFAATEKEAPGSTEPKVCGDGKCVEGENYLACCHDCGCMPGFNCESNACVPAQKDQCKDDGDCNDNDTSTSDVCLGTPKSCAHTKITACQPGDSHCPADCTYENDSNCQDPAQEAAQPAEKTQETQNITGPQAPPTIHNATITPPELRIGDAILIEAHVTDPNGNSDITRVWIEVMELAETHDEVADIYDDGQYGDLAAGDSIYSAEGVISDYYVSGTYHLNVFAQDSAGNRKKYQKTFTVTG
jgi:hypothetical protein